MNPAPRRVVITGMGAVTPLGNKFRVMWENLLEARSGVGPITIFDASTFPTRIAGEVKGLDAKSWEAKGKQFESLGRHSLFALEAAREAAAQAGLKPGAVDPSRLGIYFGAGDGGFDFHEYAEVIRASAKEESVLPSVYYKQSAERIRRAPMVEQEPQRAVNHLSREYGVKGPVSNCLTACAASSQAIGEAAEMIRAGIADAMITGGSHSMIHPLGVAGFNLLTALSTRNDDPQGASRPFDKERDGFVLAEGAGVLVLEELEHARRRGAEPLAELAGYGTTADAFRLTDPHPDGRGAIQAMRLALADAGVQPSAVQYINAHGTSTQLNDQIETAAVKAVFGSSAPKIPMSSTKSMLGHMIAAAGAVEAIISVLTIREGVIPPTANYKNPDPACDLDYVPNRARQTSVETVLSNSFGFGGQNVALVIRAFER